MAREDPPRDAPSFVATRLPPDDLDIEPSNDDCEDEDDIIAAAADEETRTTPSRSSPDVHFFGKEFSSDVTGDGPNISDGEACPSKNSWLSETAHDQGRGVFGANRQWRSFFYSPRRQQVQDDHYRVAGPWYESLQGNEPPYHTDPRPRLFPHFSSIVMENDPRLAPLDRSLSFFTRSLNHHCECGACPNCSECDETYLNNNCRSKDGTHCDYHDYDTCMTAAALDDVTHRKIGFRDLPHNRGATSIARQPSQKRTLTSRRLLTNRISHSPNTK